MKSYSNELEKTRESIIELLEAKEVNISFDRFICFSSLYLYTVKRPFRLIASENFEDEQGKNKKTIKVQVIRLERKLSKMTEDEIQNYLSDMMKLYSLFNKYKSILRAYQADFDFEYADYIINYQLLGEDEEFYEQFKEKNKKTARYKTYLLEKKKIGFIKKDINNYKYKKTKHYTLHKEYLK